MRRYGKGRNAYYAIRLGKILKIKHWPCVPKAWENWCKRGKYTKCRKRQAVLECFDQNSKKVRGYFSDFILNPALSPKKSLYPSIDHITPKNENAALVVEARIINDMKSHLDEKEFWEVVSHLCAVGIEKEKIKKPAKLKNWTPRRNY